MLPYLRGTAEPHSKKYVVEFRGLNLGDNYREGEFSHCENISTENYPCISQSPARVQTESYENGMALNGKEEGLVIANGTVYYGSIAVGSVSSEKQQIANVGKYIIIYPDKLYFDTESKELGSMDISHSVSGAVFTHNSIKAEGTVWGFKPNDAVTISGCVTFPENNKTIIVREVEGDTLKFYDNSFKIHGEIPEGETAPTSYTEQGTVTLERTAPELDFICESNYRLWGCKGDTIYGSRYNDPFNFQHFDGLAGDSYYISVGSAGEWTGCAAYSSHVCFFKEHTLHKLYGTKPSNFQVLTSQVFGVQKGSERSLCMINEILYYKGINGVYAYAGGIPENISDAFGTERFKAAVADSDGERYYISMLDRKEQPVMYVYDTHKGIWTAESADNIADMAFMKGKLHMLCKDGRLLCVDPEADRSKTQWSVTFTPFDETVNERKGYSRFHLRLEMEAGAWLSVDVKRDTDSKWQRVFTHHNERERTVSFPINPARCDCVELRIKGKGICKIRTLVREFFMGSDK